MEMIVPKKTCSLLSASSCRVLVRLATQSLQQQQNTWPDIELLEDPDPERDRPGRAAVLGITRPGLTTIRFLSQTTFTFFLSWP